MRTTRTAYAALLLLFNQAGRFGERCMGSPLFWVIALALWAATLGGCRSARPKSEVAKVDTTRTRPGHDVLPRVQPPVDSITITPRQTLLDKLRGKTPAAYRLPAGTAIRTGKKATVNVYNAAATITTIGKKATAATGAAARVTTAGKNAVQATDSAAAVSTGGGAAALGTGAAASGGAAPVEAPGIGATIAAKLTGPLGWVLAIVAAGAVGYVLYLIWAFIPFRNNNSKQA